MATNRLRHFNGCSIEELEPSHLQPRDECPAIDGLSCCSVGTCGHMRPPSKGWVWQINHHLHVSARNLVGAIPSLFKPSILWEVKEYWGGGDGKNGGSKLSDAVYECNLVGRELREFEERANYPRIAHIVFLDGYCQWAARI